MSNPTEENLNSAEVLKADSTDPRVQKVLKELKGIKSLEDLERHIGKITPAEQEILARADLNDYPPTPEELKALGADFVEQLVAISREKELAGKNSEEDKDGTES